MAWFHPENSHLLGCLDRIKGSSELNIPSVHVCVDRIHALLLINNFELRVVRIERTTAVHSR